jgi:hypothetical protein
MTDFINLFSHYSSKNLTINITCMASITGDTCKIELLL